MSTTTETIRSDHGITIYTMVAGKVTAATAYGIDHGTITKAAAAWEAIDWYRGDKAERGQALDV